MLASKSPNRHIILLTDGISQPHNYTGLLRELKRNHIAVATVALGTDVDADLLRRIARSTGGNSYTTKRARDLPKIFVKETRLSAEPIQLNGPQQVLPQASSPVVRSLVGVKLPSLSGNVVTRLRPGAQVDLIARSSSDKTEPALAQWGYRHGARGVVDARPRRALGDRVDTPDGALERRRALGRARAAARAGLGDGARRHVDLAPGRPRGGGPDARDRGCQRCFERPGGTPSRISAERERAERVHGRRRRTSGRQLRARAEPAGRASADAQLLRVDVPYATEYLPTGLGRSTLGQLVAQTGGTLLAPGDPGALTGDRRAWRVPLLVLALVLFLASVAARMLVRSQFRRA